MPLGDKVFDDDTFQPNYYTSSAESIADPDRRLNPCAPQINQRRLFQEDELTERLSEMRLTLTDLTNAWDRNVTRRRHVRIPSQNPEEITSEPNVGDLPQSSLRSETPQTVFDMEVRSQIASEDSLDLDQFIELQTWRENGEDNDSEIENNIASRVVASRRNILSTVSDPQRRSQGMNQCFSLRVAFHNKSATQQRARFNATNG